MKNHGFHGNQHFSRKEVNFTENVTAMKSWIKLVPTLCARLANFHQRSTSLNVLHLSSYNRIPPTVNAAEYSLSIVLKC